MFSESARRRSRPSGKLKSSRFVPSTVIATAWVITIIGERRTTQEANGTTPVVERTGHNRTWPDRSQQANGAGTTIRRSAVTRRCSSWGRLPLGREPTAYRVGRPVSARPLPLPLPHVLLPSGRNTAAHLSLTIEMEPRDLPLRLITSAHVHPTQSAADGIRINSTYRSRYGGGGRDAYVGSTTSVIFYRHAQSTPTVRSLVEPLAHRNSRFRKPNAAATTGRSRTDLESR